MIPTVGEPSTTASPQPQAISKSDGAAKAGHSWNGEDAHMLTRSRPRVGRFHGKSQGLPRYATRNRACEGTGVRGRKAESGA